MKFKAISRSELEHSRDRRDDVLKMNRNPDPELHPFERAREYTRALNAAKLNKMFAKPFVGQLTGHTDGVWCMAVSPRSLVPLVSGASDGQVKVWDLAHQKCLWSVDGHRGIVRGISVFHDGNSFFSGGDDKTIKHWKLSPDASTSKRTRSKARRNSDDESDEDDEEEEEEEEEGDETGKVVAPIQTFTVPYIVNAIDCHWGENMFASCGESVDIWDASRLEPVYSFSWGADAIRSVRFNPAERNIVSSSAGDRSIALYDIRQSTPLRKVILAMKTNAISWNPMEPLNFIAGNEDGNVYQFDMRNLQRATIVHKDHVGAVMDLSFAPTGKMFVSGSYDRSIRLFHTNQGRSFQIYHAKRMQRVFSCLFSRDSNFVLSGSDDSNIRIWKADASKPLTKLLSREQQNLNYGRKLIDRYKNVRELNRIHRHQLVPSMIKKEKEKKRVMASARRRKTENRIRHDPNATKPKPERERNIVKEME